MTAERHDFRAAQIPKRPPRRSFASFRAISALILREMSTTYGQKVGGYLWAVLEPVASILLLSVAFSFMLRNPAMGNNFQMFFATGMLPYLMYNNIAGKVSNALRFSRNLLAYPSVTFVDAIIARVILSLITDLLVFGIILVAIYLYFDTRTIPDLVGIGVAFGMSAMLGLGVGTMNCFLTGMFPTWQSVWSILNRPLLILSGVLYVLNDVPRPFRDYLWYNPIIQCIGKMRGSFYATYDASYVSITYVMAVSMILLVSGLVLLSRYHRIMLSK